MKWSHYKINKLRENDIKNQTFHYFDGIININIDSKIIKTIQKYFHLLNWK